jgi:hypothetical protein
MAQPMKSPIPTVSRRPRLTPTGRRLNEALAIAAEQGLLGGGRTLTVRGRMPTLLVNRAKMKGGIQSDSKLIEAALASIVAADDFGDWLVAQRGTVNRDLELEF